MAIGYTREGEGLDMRIFPPPADDMMDTMQPALDQLADHLRSSWTPSKHEHFPLAVKERAVQLLLIGHALSASVGAGLKDVWLSHLMPQALAHVRVIRPKALIEDVSQFFTVFAFMIVSAVVKDFDTTTTNVEDASTPSTWRAKSTGSTLAMNLSVLP